MIKDLKTATDDELVKRMHEIDARLATMTRIGGTSLAVTQLQNLRNVILQERQERAFYEVIGEYDQNPVVLETDPDLAALSIPTTAPVDVNTPAQTNRPRPSRRSSPVPIPTRTNRPS